MECNINTMISSLIHTRFSYFIQDLFIFEDSKKESENAMNCRMCHMVKITIYVFIRQSCIFKIIIHTHPYADSIKITPETSDQSNTYFC